MKRLYILLFAGIFSFALGLGIVQINKSFSKDQQAVVKTHGNWVSRATSVEDLFSEADLVVRVKVLAQKNRDLKQVLPIYEAEGVSRGESIDRPDHNYQPKQVGEEKFSQPFTDSTMEVLEVYKGVVNKQITVMQTGGKIGFPDGRKESVFMQDDPAFALTSEHILFLVDISDDEIHAKDRKLYRTVNPAGRYEIRGNKLLTFVEPELYSAQNIVPPKTLDELRETLSRLNEK